MSGDMAAAYLLSDVESHIVGDTSHRRKVRGRDSPALRICADAVRRDKPGGSLSVDGIVSALSPSNTFR